MKTRLVLALLTCATALSAYPVAHAADKPIVIKIGVEPGLRYDTPRFRVPPGASVKLTFTNNDQMMHNIVIAQPGSRVALVNASLLLGDDGPAMQFVPKSDKILWHTKVLSPGDAETLSFTAPKAEGVYPYVCTYPGHGFVMFGAMYVQKSDQLPPLDKDTHVPPPLPKQDTGSPFLTVTSTAKVVREFMPNTGPASIAIGMPGGRSACWDAGVCRLRYVWSGGFMDIGYHKKDTAKIIGDVYYRTQEHEGLRVGDPSTKREVEFLGYTLADSFPQFKYRINGVDVKELILVRAAGPGITRRFNVDTDMPVRFVTDPKSGVEFESDKGEWKDGVLTLTPGEAKSFSVSIIDPTKPSGKPTAKAGGAK